jgi:RNA polymerase sigma factor (sigma-70 family)
METTFKKLQQATDAALVRMFQRGSNRAFYTLVKRHEANLHKYAHTRLHHAEHEKDAVQNAWLDVLNKLQKREYKENGRFKEWLQSLLYWRALNIQKTEAHYVHGMLDEERASTNGTPEKVLFEKRLAQLRVSLGKLNEHIRTVVHLRVDKNMSFPEIAEEMKTSVKNVTSWYSRAIKRLRRKHHK